ncbi:MAG TPA: A/G-specific adenine glycosylase [Xanthomonadales bacterium]|nr:A/G-specific adenine glycosylase [Xanthomonadales bacterium]
MLWWYDVHGRRDLPWQHPRTPYRVWLSEVMLQQTQVATVVPYFERFVRELPDVAALAAAPLERVLALWAGLGYYSRAHNLHRAAQRCVEAHGGELPQDVASLAALPGIGRSTAAAIAAQAHGARHAILDGNVRRVLSRRHGIDGDPAAAATHSKLWALAESLLPGDRLADYTQAQMDLGATLCRRRNPACERCPVSDDCHARAHDAQHQLPAPKRRRASPEREVVLLLATDASGRVLCEARPPHGIWGGLFSVPEFGDRDALERERERLALSPPIALAPFSHAFTHFRLHARPYAARVAAAAAIGDNARRWVARDELDALPFPTPIRRLLLDYWNAACPAPSTAPA